MLDPFVVQRSVALWQRENVAKIWPSAALTERTLHAEEGSLCFLRLSGVLRVASEQFFILWKLFKTAHTL